MDRYRIISPCVKGKIFKVTDTSTDMLRTIKKIKLKIHNNNDILNSEGNNNNNSYKNNSTTISNQSIDNKTSSRNILKKRKTPHPPTSSLLLYHDDDDEDDDDDDDPNGTGRSVGGITAETLREISILRFLGRHENIITLKDVHTEPEKNRIFLVYEFLDYNLRDFYRNHIGSIPMSIIRSIAIQMLKGVLHCHIHGVMHRDITPRNVMITPEGIVKLVNFEAARAFIPPVRTFSHEGFSIWYCAPEILLGRKSYGLPVDIWAVVTVLAELVNKYPLFPGDSEIDELYLLFRVLGTPTEETWPGVTSLQDWNPLFPVWPKRLLERSLPTVPSNGIDFLQRMLIMNPCERMSAKEALRHPFLTTGEVQQPIIFREDTSATTGASHGSESEACPYNLRSKRQATSSS